MLKKVTVNFRSQGFAAYFFIGALFILNGFFYLYKSSLPELRGDEAASYVALIPFFHNLTAGRFVPSFLTYFHEPIQLIVQAPLLLFGLYENIARSVNIISGIALFVVLYKIGQILFGGKRYLTLILTSLYTFSGYLFLSRLAINVGLFALLTTLFLYFFLQRRIGLSLVFLFIGIFTYVDALFILPGAVVFLYFSKSTQPFPGKSIYIFVLAAVFTCLLWAAGVFLGSHFSGAYNFWEAAPFRLFTRGTGFGLGINPNLTIAVFYFGPLLVGFTVIFLVISIFAAKARPIWAVLVVPLLYFNFISRPTVHLLHFFPIFLILSVIGLEWVSGKVTRYQKLITIIIVLPVIFSGANLTYMKFLSLKSLGLKEIGTFVQSSSALCGPLYTNVDGYTARLYFGRKYVTDLSSMPDLALLSAPTSQEEKEIGTLGYQFLGETSGPSLLKIYKRGYFGEPVKIDSVNKKYYSYSNLLPYINGCL